MIYSQFSPETGNWAAFPLYDPWKHEQLSMGRRSHHNEADEEEDGYDPEAMLRSMFDNYDEIASDGDDPFGVND